MRMMNETAPQHSRPEFQLHTERFDGPAQDIRPDPPADGEEQSASRSELDHIFATIIRRCLPLLTEQDITMLCYGCAIPREMIRPPRPRNGARNAFDGPTF